MQDLDGDGIPELVVGTIGDGRANPNAGALHLLYLGLNATGDLIPSVKDWRKITTGTRALRCIDSRGWRGGARAWF